MSASSDLDLREQLVRIDRAIAESVKFAAEQRKLEAEARRFDRDRWQIWQIVVTAMGTGAALFGAGAVFIKALS